MASAKKVIRKILKVLLWIVIVLFALTLILVIIFHRYIFAASRISNGLDALKSGIGDAVYEPRSLTTEQMLTDFDFLYKNVCADSLIREQQERLLKIDLDEIYTTYRARVENCKDEYSFFSVLTAFMARLPGGHNAMVMPTDDLYAELEFPLLWELGYDDVMKSNYDYWVQFEDNVKSYTQKCAAVVRLGSDYVFVDYDFGTGVIEDIMGGRLVSLDGEPIMSAVRRVDSLYPWSYDVQNDCLRVSTLFFNDGAGDKYEAVIEMPDGSFVNKTLYCCAEYNIAAYYRPRMYPDKTAEADAGSGSTAEADSSELAVQKSYTIVTDAGRKLVYVEVPTCDSYESEMFCKDLTAALDQINAENIIIDIKSNGGGDNTFVLDGICRAVFDKKVGWINYARFPKTDITKKFFDTMIVTTGIEAEDKGDYMVFPENYTAAGEAGKKYNIYVLISGSTFSSGDIIAAITGGEDNVTMLGENTTGEGFSGNPLHYYLPESKFGFAFGVGISEQVPDDNVAGTAPDIYCPVDWECYLKRKELSADPDTADYVYTYEYRQLWDKPLTEALKLIDSRS